MAWPVASHSCAFRAMMNNFNFIDSNKKQNRITESTSVRRNQS